MASGKPDAISFFGENVLQTGAAYIDKKLLGYNQFFFEKLTDYGIMVLITMTLLGV